MNARVCISTLLLMLPHLACPMNDKTKREAFVKEAVEEHYHLFDLTLPAIALDTPNIQKTVKQLMIKECERVLKAHIAYPPRTWRTTTSPTETLLFKGVMQNDAATIQPDLKGAESARHALYRKANPNCYNADGSTPLIEALANNNIAQRKQNVELLLKAGANPNGASAELITPLHCAFVKYQHDQAAHARADQIIQSFEIIKLLVDHGARLKIALNDELNVSGNATPLSVICYSTQANVHAVYYVLTHVYPEDILLGPDEHSIVQAIMARNALLLALSQLHPFILNAVSERTDKAGILELLEPNLVYENYERQVADNVAKMMNALAEQK